MAVMGVTILRNASVLDPEKGELAPGQSVVVEGGRIADVALLIGHLRPAVLGRVEAMPGDPHHAGDALVRLQERYEAGAEGTRRTGDGDGEAASGRHLETIPSRAAAVLGRCAPACRALLTRLHHPQNVRWK